MSGLIAAANELIAAARAFFAQLTATILAPILDWLIRLSARERNDQ